MPFIQLPGITGLHDRVQSGIVSHVQPPLSLSFLDLLTSLPQQEGSDLDLISQTKGGLDQGGLVLPEEQWDQLEQYLDEWISYFQHLSVPTFDSPVLDQDDQPVFRAMLSELSEWISQTLGKGTQEQGKPGQSVQSPEFDLLSLLNQVRESNLRIPAEIADKLKKVMDLAAKSFPERITEPIIKSVAEPVQEPIMEPVKIMPEKGIHRARPFMKPLAENFIFQHGGRMAEHVEFQPDPALSVAEQPIRAISNQVPTEFFIRQRDIQEKPVFHPPMVPVKVTAEQFVREMSQFMGKMKWASTQGISEAKITLFPEHLGQVDVKLSLHDGKVIAQFVTDTLAGKDLIESNLVSLRAALQQQGLKVDQMDVSYASGQATGSGNHLSKEGSRPFHQGHQSKRQAGMAKLDTQLRPELDSLSEMSLFYGASYEQAGEFRNLNLKA